MRVIFIGSVTFSLNMLEHLINTNTEIVGVCTKSSSGFNSDYVDLGEYCRLHDIPFLYTDNINSEEVLDWMLSLSPDVIFCLGWSQIIKEKILAIAPKGVIGYHPSALPRNRGRHPIIWALVLGLSETASTFFQMDQSVDGGPIISQIRIPIERDDDALSLYNKLIVVAKCQLGEIVSKLESGTIFLSPQKGEANTWRKRNYADGEIDWRMSADNIHNLVRGLSHPYSGAHFVYHGEEVKVWKTQISHEDPENVEPGRVLSKPKGGVIIKCGTGSIQLMDISPQCELIEGEYL